MKKIFEWLNAIDLFFERMAEKFFGEEAQDDNFDR